MAVNKRCYACMSIKSLDEFGKNVTKADGLTDECKRCRNESQRTRVQHTKYNQSRAAFSNQLRYKYGITVEDYERMSASQGGLCAICKKPGSNLAGKAVRLAVDHSHSTGEIRGLLCIRCNLAVEVFAEDHDRIDRMVNYLDAAAGAPINE